MDRGLVSVVSNNNSNNISHNSNSSSHNNVANKSLSPMSGPLLMSPPTFSRLPPDGHEFPPNFTEPLLLTMTGGGSNTTAAKVTTTMVRSQPQSKIVGVETKRIRSLSDEPPAPPTSLPPPLDLKMSRNGASAFVELRKKSIETPGNGIQLEIGNGMPKTPSPPLGTKKGSEWRKDEKSEKSVRDKIAMFSQGQSSPPAETATLKKIWNRSTDDLLSASGPNSYSNFNDSSYSAKGFESMAKKARSVENLDDLDGPVPSPNYRTRPKENRDEEVGVYIAGGFKKTMSVDVLNEPGLREETLYYKPLNDDLTSKYASLPRRTSATNVTTSSAASTPQLTRTTSFSGYSQASNAAERRRSSITNLLEQRKKSMSKLRGLIIPEKSAGFEIKMDTILFDLPEIKSADLEKISIQITTPGRDKITSNGSSKNKQQNGVEKRGLFASPSAEKGLQRPLFQSSLSEPANSYQSIFESNRRSFGTALGDKKTGKDDLARASLNNALPPTKPPRTSLIYNPQRSYVMDDSEDSDSLVSLQSSRISTPPHSPVAPANLLAVPEKLPLTRTLSNETTTSIASSTASTLTSGSGSQASCSSMGSTPTGPDSKRKGLKQSPLYENSMARKSVLASAKTRNGNAKNLLEDSINDEDSTDGYDDDQVFKRPKPKQRSSVGAQQNGKVNGNSGMTNYKVITEKDTPKKDQVIKVATFVEVIDDFLPPPQTPIEKVIQLTSELLLIERQAASFEKDLKKANAEPAKSSTSESEPEMNDLVKWVRTEAAKSKEMNGSEERNGTQKSIPSSLSPVADRPIVPRSLVEPKKLTTADLRKQFELKGNSPPSPPSNGYAKTATTPVKEKTNFHDRFSSWESVASNSSSGISSMPATRSIPSSETAQSTPTDFGSFTSIGSSHSLLTAQDLQAIIEEADPPLKNPDAFVIVLQRESPESSIGITLAGGADYEAKEITVHKVLTASPAEKDGRLKKGDRILAINGLSMRGLTHRESVTVLKTPRSEVVLAVTRSPSAPVASKAKRPSLGSLSSLLERDCDEGEGKKTTGYHKASRSLDLDAMICDGDSVCSSELLDERTSLEGESFVPTTFKKMTSLPKGAQEVEVVKDTCGLGFSIEGGFDSPLGNCPLTVKKVFMGGAAEKSGRIRSGNEILAINGYTTSNMTRVTAWNYMKKLGLGPVRIVIL